MPKLTINGKEIEVASGSTVLQACEEAGYEIPRFCYHERLSIAGNCRMCLVEMEKSPKPIASCAMPAGDGMVIHTDTPKVKKAREGVMEFLLINHPLDCPICDQGGECDLQDQAVAYGAGKSRYDENKRAVADKYMGPLIKTIMTRCIHCTRCIRFAEEVAGVPDLGAVNRGEKMEITTYLEKTLDSELSGNVIDLCPVGALTSKPYAFTARSWELKKTESIDVMDAVGSNIRVDSRGNEVMRILPRLHEDVNEEWISDKTRFVYDGLKKRRLDRPWVKKRGKLQEATWGEAFEAIAKALKGKKGDEIAGVVGDLQDMESMFALRELLSSLGSSQIECRVNGAAYETGSRAGYLFNSTIAGIEEADQLVIIGANPRIEAAVLNARIRKAVVHNDLKVYVFGTEEDLTYEYEGHGDSMADVQAFLDGKHKISAAFKKAKRPMLIVGEGALCRPDGSAILAAAAKSVDIYKLAKKGWNGFNVLHTAASRVGALDLGLVTKAGMAWLGKQAKDGKLKVLFNLGVDEIALDDFKKAFTIYLGTHGDMGAQNADVILPAAAYTEKPGTFINTEGRVQRALRAIFPPGDAREDWTILRALSDVIGKTLPFDTLDQLRAAMAKALPHVETLDETPQETWSTVSKAGKIAAKGGMTSVIANFWFSNPVARASAIMADCNAAREEEGATGTDG